MIHYLHRKTKKGNYLYWLAKVTANTVEIQEGDILTDKKIKIKKSTSEEEAIQYITTQKTKKKDYVESELRITDLFEICFRDVETINDFLKVLQRNKVADILNLSNYSEEIQQRILEHNGSAIKYITKPSSKLISIAVNQNGYAIRYIDSPNIELQIEAVKNNAMALKFIDNQTPELIECAIQNHNIYFAFSYIKTPTRENLYQLLEKGISLRDLKISTELKEDKAFALKAIEAKADNYEEIADTLKKDKEIALLALQHKPKMIRYIDKELLKSKSFVMQALAYCSDIPYYAYYAKSDVINDKEFMLKALSVSGIELEFASDALKEDKDIIIAALEADLNAIQFVPKALKSDKEIKKILKIKP
jgi:hypothetical protein